ncbi:alpha/beta fold hydrolase [Gordonia sp. LSe1-13]|uniref:Alpha/beta fold hydrolase n=1 Tax=Gordonia sesuvii TaxID=3116777 RepID=A0ABU7MFR2_9ACTN|nr:alpha/beta fold hydrolase [Gordonia sp. LSe1-13]
MALMVEWSRSDVDSDGVRLAVFRAVADTAQQTALDQSRGDESRPVAILVHGWPDSHYLWTHVAPILAATCDVYAYDTRGYGDSDRPKTTEDYRLDRLARDLFAVADAVSPDRPVHVIGHDWGGIQTWEAVCTPGAEHRIASYVSVSGPNLDYADVWLKAQWRPPSARGVRDYFTQQACLLYARFFKIPRVSDALVGAALSPRRWTRFVARTEKVDPTQIVLAPTFRQDVRSGLRYYRANLSRRRRPPHARPTSVPVLELINTRDVALRPPLFSQTDRFAQTSERRVSHTGHWLPLAHPEKLAADALEFIHAHHSERRTPASGAQQ